MTAMPAAAAPKPPAEQWWLRKWQAEQKLWPLTRGQGVTIALLDTGVNAKLEEFRGADLAAGGDIIDGTTNGLTDPAPGEHGTGVSALIVGQGQGAGIVGVAPAARLLSLRANNNTYGAATPESMAKAIRSAADQGAKVINMSMGSTSDSGLACDLVLQNAVDHALKRDAIIVAAAGNIANGRTFSAQPAGCTGVLAVGAVDKQGRPADFSLRQPYISVAAPGVDTIALMTDSLTHKGYLEDSQGTSHAAGLTSGVVALLRSRYPHSSAEEILRKITGTALDVGPHGRDDQTGYGIIQPHKALTATIPGSVTSPVYEHWEQSLRERAANPPPTPEEENPPSFVPLRTRVIQVGVPMFAAALLAALSLIIYLRLRRRSISDAGGRAATPWK